MAKMLPSEPMSWQIETEADEQEITSTTLLAIDVDPRVSQLRLGLRIRTGGEPALWNGAMIRRFFTVERTCWRPVVAWLRGDTAAALLARIQAGYTGTRLWSGDWTGQWSTDALQALDALHEALSARVEQP